MTERRRPHRRGGRGPRSYNRTTESNGEPNPYLDGAETPVEGGEPIDNAPPPTVSVATEDASPASPPPPPPASPAPAAAPPSAESSGEMREQEQRAPREDRGPDQRPPREHREHRHHQRDQRGGDRNENGAGGRQHNQQFNGNGRRNRRNRGRGRQREHQPNQPPTPIVADSETQGWFDPSRDGGFIRRAANSYLAECRRRVRRRRISSGSTACDAATRSSRARAAIIAGAVPWSICSRSTNRIRRSPTRRPDFGSLTATYPERKLFLETGRPAKGGPELTRRAIDLIAPIGYGQRALIVAPARAGKTMLLHAITEGIAINHPNATLLILLVDERPEEVSEAISWGVGEVIASSFDQPADRHVEVTEMVLEHARRLVEMGKDVVIVLDSLTRMARAHNTAERGTGRTLSGGLDSSAMAKPKAFFGSARSVAAKDGGGSLTIIATALVETGSRMDDVIFEEFKGTGNCEIKLDRSLSEKRIFPAFDIATSGTRREEKLYKPEQLDAVYTLRRGLQQMPPQAAMEWMIKRIANTSNNDALLAGL